MDKDKNTDISKYLKETYTKDSFGGETGLLAVREDASRHIQKTDKEGIYNMFTEIVDNAFDETVETMGRMKLINPNIILEPLEIKIKINQLEGTCEIEDQGRGIPIEMNDKYGLPTVCCIYEKDNTGGKGNKSGVTNKGYLSKTMGVHGAGAFVVTACSEYLTARTRVFNEERNCVEIYEIEYREGVPVEGEDRIGGRLKYLGDDTSIIANGRRNTGTTTSFKPDLKIMSLYNPRTQLTEKDYYLEPQLKKRIEDTLYTMEDPLIVTLDIDGVVKVYDSRLLSYTYNKVEGQDYLRVQLEPDAEMAEKMAGERVSNFYIDLILMPTVDPYDLNKYEGFVNRIKVSKSPHVDTLKYSINAEISRRCQQDPELKGYFRSDQLRGLKVIPLLYVEQAEWTGQVKTDYSDSRVASYVGQLVAKSGVLPVGGHFDNLINYSFGCSRPWLIADKSKSEEMAKVRDAQLRREKSIKEEKKLKEKLSEDLRFLNKAGEFIFTSDVTNSWVAIVEGRSAGNILRPVLSKMPNLAVFTGMWGKIDNANKIEAFGTRPYKTLADKKRDNGIVTTSDKLDVLYSSPFERFLIATDNDSDGDHMRALQRFYIWKRHPRIIMEGRVFDIVPPYCDYTCNSGLTYSYKGEVKSLGTSGTIRGRDEYETVVRCFPGQVKIKLFKGLGSLASSEMYRTLNEPKNWSQVLPLTSEEEYQIDKMFTDSSLFKKIFTEVNYMEEMAIRKEKIKSTIYKDTTLSPEVLVNQYLAADYPVFTSVSRRSIEDYEEKGSDVIEIDLLKTQLESVKENYGILY